MGVQRNFLVLTAALFIAISGCATSNLENLKKQSEGHRLLGEEYIRQQDYTSALRSLLKAEQLYADDPVLQNDLGIAYMGKGQMELAIRHFDTALELKPDYSEARNNKGVAYMKNGLWDDAIEQFLNVIKDLVYPTPHYPLFNLGWAYYNKRNYTLSEKYYNEALAISPNYLLALRGLGLTYIAIGKGQKAAEVLERAIDIYSKEPRLYFDLAKAYTISGDREKAIAAYQNVITISPQGKWAAEAKKAISKLQ